MKDNEWQEFIKQINVTELKDYAHLYKNGPDERVEIVKTVSDFLRFGFFTIRTKSEDGTIHVPDITEITIRKIANHVKVSFKGE